MTAYYNEVDPYAAEWLRNLIAAGHIAPGFVDERDIRDVLPDDLVEFTQCHFFAGIGVWSHSLRRAGWSDDRPIWTGSCPCQPFSAAGRGLGTSDERHLWPHWFHLVTQCKPAVVLGEQVASKDGLAWFDLVSADLETQGYATAAADLCAAGFSGAHIRQRLYFVGLGHAQYPRLEGLTGTDNNAGGWSDTDRPAAEASVPDGVGNTDMRGRELLAVEQSASLLGEKDRDGSSERSGDPGSGTFDGSGATNLGRYAADWLLCRDGKWRPVEPGTCPLADAPPARVGRLRAYGNGLDAETATNFIESVMEC